jgi:hypothetical protein
LVPPEEREGLEALLRELHGPFRRVLCGRDLEFVEFLWARRHIHWHEGWANRLRAVDASLPVCLARGRNQGAGQ